MMNSSLNQGSATIYQFPAWPRARAETQRKERERAETPQSPPIAVSSAWYHAAALEEPQAS